MTRFQPFEEEEWEEEEGGKAVPDANVEAHFCLGIVAIIVGISLLAYIGANLVDASPLHSTPLELAGVEVLIGVMAVALLSCIACAACTPKVADSMPLWVMTVGTVLSIGIVAFIAALLALDSKTLAADVGVGALVVSFCSCYCYARVLIAYDPGRKRNKMWPRAKRDKWGSIAKQVAGHPENVEPADTWLSVVLMWGTLPLCLPIAIAAALSPRFFRSLSLATKNSARRGRPLVDAPLWWVYALATLISLAVSGSRLAFQLEARKRFGDGVWFWQSEGAWACTYQRVDEIARSQQKRDAGFAATTAVVPEMFPRGIVLFLSNYIAKTRGELSEWQDLRSMLHEHFLDTGMAAYTRRVSLLDERIAADWEAPSLKQLQDDAHTARLVAKCVFFVVFGIWVTDAEAKTLASWKKAAALFVLPRMVHRFLLNIGLVRIQHLREETIAIVRKYKLESVFFAANDSLNPRYQRQTVVQLADEVMFAFCFAGVIGTGSAVASTVAALGGKLATVADKYVQFDQQPAELLSLYRQNPEAFIKETLRLDPPVTSGAALLRDELKDSSPLGVGLVAKGAYEQYVIALANRDPAVFPEPDKFNPQRRNLDDALTWNGKAFSAEESKYPRICPGRYLSLTIARKVVDRGLAKESPTA